jgi:CopG family transcriptional regulator/antitoxin EndoAI
MHRRINITLPDEAVRLLDRVASKGDRSRFIAEAIKHYVTQAGRAKRRRQVREGALRRAERDRVLVRDWFLLAEDVPSRRGR